MSSINTKKNISFKTIFSVFAVFTVAITAIRFYQLFTLTEADSSGFFTRINWSVFALYIGVVLFSAVICVLVNMTNKVPASKPIRGKNKGLFIGGVLMAVGLGWDVAVSLSQVIKVFTTFKSTNLFSYLLTNGYVAVIFEIICGLVACVYFLVYALSYKDGKNTFYEYKFMAIMPLFWSLCRIIGRFLTKISFVQLADLILELVMLSFMMLFFLSFARVSSQVCQKYEMRKAMRYGLAAAIPALVIGITRCVVSVIGKSALLPRGFGFNLADLFFGVFAVIYVLESSKSDRPASDDEYIVDEEEKAREEEEIDDDFLDKQ